MNHGELGECATVIGGSLAGLMSARVLAEHFTQVLLLERDNIEDDFRVHKSVPQGHHAHGLMIGGQLAMARLYPGFIEKLFCFSSDQRREAGCDGGQRLISGGS
jgi:hypothetical protein